MAADIAGRLARIRSTLPAGVELVAVSKFHPAEAVAEAYAAGQRHFGESRVQEILTKAPVLPDDICWHFIGHLQTNKVRQLIASGCVGLVESVDSEHLLQAIDKASEQAGRITRVLLQVHVAREETKFGFTPEQLLQYFGGRGYQALKATHLCGLMAMASNVDDLVQISEEFKTVAALRQQIIAECPDLVGFDTLSMGMSDDYPLAIAQGSNSIRIGTAIFGERI